MATRLGLIRVHKLVSTSPWDLLFRPIQEMLPTQVHKDVGHIILVYSPIIVPVENLEGLAYFSHLDCCKVCSSAVRSSRRTAGSDSHHLGRIPGRIGSLGR